MIMICNYYKNHLLIMFLTVSNIKTQDSSIGVLYILYNICWPYTLKLYL